MKKRLLSLVMVLMAILTLVACKKDTKPTENTVPLILSSQEVDTVFNPFFASSAPDSTVVGYTQLSMLNSDKNGKVVYGDKEPVVVKDLEYTTVGSEGDDNYTTTYHFVLKNNIKFSNGSPLTMKDVLFNLYVYLDQAYFGSSTIYSTDIVGLQEYRTQEESEDAQDRFMEQFQTAASQRIDNLATAAYDIKDEIGDASITVDEFRTKLAEFEIEHLVEDFDKACDLFDEELRTDFKNAKGTAESISFKDANGNMKKGLLTTDVEAFLYNEGYITFNRNTGKLESGLVTNVADLKAWTEERAIEVIKEDKLPKDIDEIIYYWATASELYSFIINEELGAYSEANPDRKYQNISGIKFANREASVTVNGVTYDKPTYNSDGSVASGNEVLSITINGVDPKAIWNFSFNVAPMYYYSNQEEIDKFDYVSNFGVKYNSSDFMNNVVNADSKNGLPVGAGVYQVSNENGDTTGVKEGGFYNSNVLYFARNEYFVLGAAKIKYLNLKVIPSNGLENALANKETDFAQPNAKNQTINNLNNMDDIESVTIPTSGYGYIGVNAAKVPDIKVRQAIMHAINTEQTATYYEGHAQPIWRSISKESWAYPEEATAYYPYLGAKIPENLDVVNPDYADYVESLGYKAGQTMSVADQKAFIISLVEEAGYTKDANGVYTKGNHKLKYTFTVAGNEQDHPAYLPFLNAASVLNDCGFEITVSPDSQALQKLTSGDLAVWAAAWSSPVDPDMYQVYHRDSTATSTKNWGYPQIKQNVGGKYNIEAELVDLLSEKIEEARETLDQEEREYLYAEALDIVMELAIELPTYQRDDLFAYNTAKIDKNTLTPQKDLTSYNGLLSEIWNVSLNKEQ